MSRRAPSDDHLQSLFIIFAVCITSYISVGDLSAATDKDNYYHYQSLDANGANENDYYGLALNFYMMSDMDASLVWLGKLLDFNTMHRDGLLLRGKIRLMQNRYAEARQELERALSISEDHAVYILLENAYSALGQDELAEAARQRTLDLPK